VIGRRPARRIERERIALALADGRAVDIERVRDPRARRLKLSVGEGGVRLTLPRAASLREAQAFLALHVDWLATQLARQPRVEAMPLVPGRIDALPLRGESIPLRWDEGRFARLARDDDGIAIQLPGAARPGTAARLLRDFYVAQAQADVGRWLPRYLPSLPRPPSRLRLRPLRSLWGSLSPDDAVSLDLALVLAPPAAFEYVLVHELCHLLQRNHGPRFWREVEARLPGWRVQRAYLRGEGMAVKGVLRGLLDAQ
jgi:predicted metal-dependent hydrolase